MRRGVQFLAIAELATEIIAASHRLLGVALLERAPDVMRGGGKQDEAALGQRGFQCGDDRLVLSNPGGEEGILCLHPRAIRRDGGNSTRGTGKTPIDETV